MHFILPSSRSFDCLSERPPPPLAVVDGFRPRPRRRIQYRIPVGVDRGSGRGTIVEKSFVVIGKLIEIRERLQAPRLFVAAIGQQQLRDRKIEISRVELHRLGGCERHGGDRELQRSNAVAIPTS